MVKHQAVIDEALSSSHSATNEIGPDAAGATRKIEPGPRCGGGPKAKTDTDLPQIGLKRACGARFGLCGDRNPHAVALGATHLKPSHRLSATPEDCAGIRARAVAVLARP